MALHLTPEEHDANPPHTWEVVKVSPTVWHLRQKGETSPLSSFRTKRDAEEAKTRGFIFDLYQKEGRRFAGESVPGWKPYHRRVQV